MNTIRCFIAVDVEDPGILLRVAGLQEQLKATGAKLKLVEPENLHLTIRFIGEVPKEVVEKISDALREVDFEPFKAHFAGLGAFPTPRNPRVVWVDVKEGARELSDLNVKVNKSLAKLKLPKPSEEFTPHLTIARLKTGGSSLSRVVEENSSVEVGTMVVEKIRLKKSTLTPRGPVYETLFEKLAKR
ncbi:MAG: RNA 2',3'-cyclic phosphodiesterase [Thermofilaceae archaeon]|nr:RNA 2',3'-cyclic phosphodiesterase [Thermofilaceae archaeon]MDW8003262.1 RNA 2',3'-cyclic phosphodiesterase [Thermofilaceae archaeon]